ncbi:hypothetical protein F441_20995 [Phytophthora nicotianae CJ01A1]|uniref:EF-hand domain-containing protein n=3 Tax=Phytophthora nicotianae TaxID=4792 RepID=W2Y5C8_PHYNI|nr:hypothetical protein L915_20549 [Phytophthora nicotianae]ETP01796.1 hypothetical protein F441_20995 [Phytophthora nicotianae CJ01A1]ETP29937.1 hypothetical protein F442_20952 [Phytophthora nicotianae P10297]ETL25760.1 hypothetical protein L916_20411 [Phytophthora nicotianae]ETL78965.1 hypothetical protein L917_20288 [Phytophthora nicotianae]
MNKHRHKQPDTSNEFSDALNREKFAVKIATKTNPRGSKVVPGITVNVKTSVQKPVTELNASIDTDPASTDSSNRRSSVRKQSQPTDTRANHPDEDAEGVYKIFVQTRRCEELCSGLGLTMKDIRKMKRKYDANDMFHSGEINQAEFFFMIKEERRPLTLGILKFADVPESQKFLSFDQYLLCVVNFAVLTKPELYQFVFDLYDDDQSGALDEREFTKMSLELQSKQFHFQANVSMAIKLLEGKEGRAVFTPDDGLVDMGEFMKFAKNFPVAFYPIMNMQKNVRASTLGESRWSRITANKLKVQELVSYMRRHQGAIPQLTFRESIVNIFSSEIFHIRKRAGELYARELVQRHRLSTVDIDGD